MAHPNITYCGNVHPVVQFQDLKDYLKKSTPLVQQEYGGAFPLGLWLPNSALDEALSEKGLSELKAELDRLQTRPATFNAFPMNVFHGERVKEKVYQPDWSDPERLAYTIRVAELGIELGMDNFCISTLSGGFRANDDMRKIDQYIHHWLEWVQWARLLEERTGQRVALALEPEPFNTMEDESDAICIWHTLVGQGAKRYIPESDLKRHLGLCFDTCHFSVRYVPLISSWERLKAHGMPVHKIQVSVAPRWTKSMGQEALEQFFNWEEPVYLHQSFAQVDGERHDFLDLDQAKKFRGRIEEWRTHFHVPIHQSHREDSTGHDLIEFLAHVKKEKEQPLLEVETYSFASMGDQWGEPEPLEQSIAKEMLWLQNQIT